MITVSVNELRDNLMHYLDQITSGETILIMQKNRYVARMVSVNQNDWRDNMKILPKLLVPPSQIIEPLTDIWDGYL